MKPNEANLTLRQQYERNRQNADPESKFRASTDVFLRKLIGHSVTVRFQGGDEVTAVFATMDRFTIRLGADLVVFKHSVQSIRLAASGAGSRT